MIWRERIICDPGILAGKPTLKGTRVSVEQVLSLLAGGTTWASILENYPRLKAEDIEACLSYAAEMAATRPSVPLAS